MGSEDVVRREEVRSTLEARRELGADYEEALVESFAQRIEQRLDRTQRKPVQAKKDDDSSQRFVLAIVSLGCAIPITGIALGAGGLAGLIVAWIGIVLVNVAARAR